MTDHSSDGAAVTFAARAANDAALVAFAAQTAHEAAPGLAAATDEQVDAVLAAMARRLSSGAEPIFAANRSDVDAARAAGVSPGVLDRLRLDDQRLSAMAAQVTALADVDHPRPYEHVRDLPDGLVVQRWRRPVGVIGANFEARPNVVVDIAAQLIKSRNGGVLRTGAAALDSAAALVDVVVGPALADAGLDPAAIALVRSRGHDAAHALVSLPGLVPLVILRGSGDSTRELAQQAAVHGVRTLAHADGGAVIYLDEAADTAQALRIIESSVDRFGVCNRLNLLLIHTSRWAELVDAVTRRLHTRQPPLACSLPPHDHPLGYEWALDPAREATVTIAEATSAADAARIANEHTSGLAAAIVTDDQTAAEGFLRAYTGTGAFWNATPRLLDGYKMLAVAETGINIDRVPGPRGPVTFRDLCLHQYVVLPAHRTAVHPLGGASRSDAR